MEFDRGVYSESGTNFEGWKQAFKNEGYKLPIIIFWNVAGNTKGVPVTKFDNDVALISGFSTNILENLLTLENYTPTNIMLEKLAIYLEMLKNSNENKFLFFMFLLFLMVYGDKSGTKWCFAEVVCNAGNHNFV